LQNRFALEIQRAQGMPDARCTRDLMRNVHKKCAHEHTGEAENIRHSLRNGFTAYNALSPVSLVLLPPSTPTSGRQDHTSLPYALAARVSRSLSVHRNPPLVVTTADAHSEWDGMAIDIPCFTFLEKRNIFNSHKFWA
jgi:hypothetical protein